MSTTIFSSRLNKTPALYSFLIYLFVAPAWLLAQINNAGCLSGGFGVDAGLYSNIIEYGAGSPAANSKDWFYSSANGGSGLGIIDESNTATIRALLQGPGNPSYEARMNSGLNSIVDGKVRIDAVFSRDPFGGTGALDPTSYVQASKMAKTRLFGLRVPPMYWVKTIWWMWPDICLETAPPCMMICGL